MRRLLGFTMLELILVMVIVALLSIAMIPRTVDNGVAFITETEAVVSLLDNARKEAITRHQNIYFKVIDERTCGYNNIDGNLSADFSILRLNYGNFTNSQFVVTFNAAGVPDDHHNHTLIIISKTSRSAITIEASTGKITYEKS